MSNPSTKKQLSNVWLMAVEDLIAMSESEIDAELRELGMDPQVAAGKAKLAVERGVSRARERQRAQLRAKMEAARSTAKSARDSSVTADQARERIAKLQAANDAMLTMAARNRSPQDLSDQEALDLYWKIEELKS
jgi:hypothetical protein